ncbi:MAG: hypothetical protein MUP44_12330, partial [Anaerolineales bacterium]|nr:hypothetical protein [Anaerolineales bacterium]
MVRIRYALVSIGIVILLAACNAPAQEDAATATQKDLLPEVTLEPGPADPTITVGVTPPAVEMQEPTFEFELPTSEPPGETLPAQDRLKAGDDLSLEYIEMISAELGWAIGGEGGQADSILRSEDGGLSWDEVSPPEPIDNVDVQMAVAGFLDESSAWVVYHSEVDSRMSVRLSQKVWHTRDAGRHWQASAPVSLEFIGSLRSPAWIQFTSPDQGWLLANYGGAGMQRYPVYLLHSDDAGSHWEILEDPYDGLWLQSCPKTGWDWSSSGTGILTLGLCPFESAEIRL